MTEKTVYIQMYVSIVRRRKHVHHKVNGTKMSIGKKNKNNTVYICKVPTYGVTHNQRNTLVRHSISRDTTYVCDCAFDRSHILIYVFISIAIRIAYNISMSVSGVICTQ